MFPYCNLIDSEVPSVSIVSKFREYRFDSDLILVASSDNLPSPDLIRQVALCFKDPEVGAVTVYNDHEPARLTGLELFWGAPSLGRIKARSAAICFRREVAEGMDNASLTAPAPEIIDSLAARGWKTLRVHSHI